MNNNWEHNDWEDNDWDELSQDNQEDYDDAGIKQITDFFAALDARASAMRDGQPHDAWDAEFSEEVDQEQTPRPARRCSDTLARGTSRRCRLNGQA